MQLRKIITIVMLLSFMLLINLKVTATTSEETSEQTELQENNDQKINDGVYIGEINVGGLNEGEAKALVDQHVNDLFSKEILITIDDKETKAILGELGYYWSNTDIISESVSLCKTGNVIKRFKDQIDVEKDTKVYDIVYDISDESLAEKVKSYSKEYNVYSVNPKIIKQGSSFVVEGNTATGRVIDVESSIGKIKNFLLNELNEENKSIALVVVDDQPSTTVEDAKKVKDLLGSYSTTFTTNAGNWNRNMNIKNSARLINGSVVYPGETLSTNDQINPCTAANGYYPAGTYENGKVVDSIGGGICQLSSTLYNAILRAELQVVQRANHSMTVGYVPLAADAALAGTWKDLKFKNNTSVPVYVETIYTEGRLTVNLYGQETRPAGRSVKFVSETISTIPFTEVVKEDSTKPTGYRSVTSAGRTGYVAKLWKHIYMNGARQSVELVNTSSYRSSPANVVVGTAQASVTPEPSTPEPTTPESTTPESTTPEPTTPKPTTPKPTPDPDIKPEE